MIERSQKTINSGTKIGDSVSATLKGRASGNLQLVHANYHFVSEFIVIGVMEFDRIVFSQPDLHYMLYIPKTLLVEENCLCNGALEEYTGSKSGKQCLSSQLY